MTLPTPDNLRADLVKAAYAQARHQLRLPAQDNESDRTHGIVAQALMDFADRIERPAQAEGAVAEQGPFPCKCTRLTLACRWPNCEAGTTKAEPLAAPAPTQPIEAKADALIKQAQAVQLELLNLAARYDVGTRPRGTIINASDTLTELVVAIRAALAVQPSPAPTQGLADDAPPMLKALIHALHEYELAGEHEVPSPVEAFRVALARRGFIVRAVSEPSPGPSIADLKPGTYGLFIDRDGGGCIYADDGPGCQSRRIKSWPATDGGMG